MELNGKTALILGASRGIGRACARRLAEAGARVIVTWFDWPEDSASLCREFAAPPHLAVEVDLRDPGQIERLLQQVAAHTGGALDILINNIERGGMPIVHGAYTPEQWELEMATTIKAKWWVVHHAMPLLKKSPAGAIVTLSSIAGIVGRTGPAGLIFNDGYAAANRAISSFTETWAREGAPTVRVNELMLGFIQHRHAEYTRGWGLLHEKERQAILKRALLQRSGSVEEVIAAIWFLLTEATYMTGATLRLDGGYTVAAEKIPPMPAGVE